MVAGGRRSSISNRIVLIGGLAIAIPLVVTSVLLTLKAKAALEAEAQDRLAGITAKAIQMCFMNEEFAQGKLSADAKVLREQFDRAGRAIPELGKDFAAVDHTERLTGSLATVFRMADREMVRVATTVRKRDGSRAVGTTIQQDSPVFQAIRAGRSYRGRAKVVEDWCATQYDPIREDGKVVGALFVGVKLQDLSSLRNVLTRMRSWSTGYTYVIDSSGRIVLHPDAAAGDDGARYAPVAEVLARRESSIRYRRNGTDIIASWQYFEPWDWYVVSEVPARELFFPVQSIVLFAGIAMLGFLTLGLATMYAYSKKVLNPVTELARAVDRVAKGDRTARFEAGASGEMALLVASFNRLVTDLDNTSVSKDYVNNILNSMIDTVAIVSPDGTIKSCNAAICSLLGYAETELAGRPVISILGEDRDGGDSVLEEVRTRGVISNREIAYVTANGRTVPMLLSASPMSGGGRGAEDIVWVAHDITIRKRSEQELAQLEEQLRQSQKMEAIGKLAGGVAHDFNNLLTVITGYCDLIVSRLPRDAPWRKEVEGMAEAADRAASVTRQLLAFSRKQVFQLRVVNMNGVVANVDGMLRRLIGEDIDLLTRPGADLWDVRVDPAQIEQALVNIVVNARDAMSEGGTLTIETANVELEEAYAQSHLGLKPGPFVMIAISDTGCGMDEAVRSRIFEPFFTTKGFGKGTGLGLSTVYGIIKQSGGYIWVYSEPGRGTTFKIYLPGETRAERHPAPSDGRADVFDSGGAETILVAEDEDRVRDLVTEILAQAGYRVLAAGDGKEALRIGEGHEGRIDLLMTDVVMPHMNGRELARRLVSLKPDIKVIYMSGYTEDAIIHHGVLDPGVHFVQKPFRVADLKRKVREVLDAGAVTA